MEIWKTISGFENYEVSSLSNVKRKEGTSHLRSINLKGTKDKDGYLKVNLKVSQKTNTKFIHRLVATAFIINTENKPQVNNINGIKDDNRVENLEWCTLSENRQHAYDTGLQNSDSRKGEKNNFNKLKKEQVEFIINEYKAKKVFQHQLALKFNVSQSCISIIVNKKNWKWI